MEVAFPYTHACPIRLQEIVHAWRRRRPLAENERNNRIHVNTVRTSHFGLRAGGQCARRPLRFSIVPPFKLLLVLLFGKLARQQKAKVKDTTLKDWAPIFVPHVGPPTTHTASHAGQKDFVPTALATYTRAYIPLCIIGVNIPREFRVGLGLREKKTKNVNEHRPLSGTRVDETPKRIKRPSSKSKANIKAAAGMQFRFLLRFFLSFLTH